MFTRSILQNVLSVALSLNIALLVYAQENSESIESSSAAGNDKVAEIMRTFSPKGAQRDDSQPTPPNQMIDRLRARDGIEVDLMVHEPQISQPLFITWDSRGRMWAVQYRQYQYPADLKVVRFDQYLRAVFDKVPLPPPQGAKGADKITMFEDTNGDGYFDKSKDVITGLNIASSVQVGPDGIWVLNPPYLLHYPDEDGDGTPDAEPEVHLSGFGLQDTHSVANSLTWGPDGWLYGANGSTTVGTISSSVTKGVQFQGQCIWRYHPQSRVFEIYAEGGGNTFSLEIDSKGRVFSGTNGGSKRGYYYPQGSYSDKNWGKHGPLTNPYAFGYFRGMPMQGDTRRFAQAFAIYEGGLFPSEFDKTIIAPNSLQNLVWHSRRIRDGSNYRTVDLENLIETDDRWFRPVYCGVGPDGGIYLADWYDTRLSHVNPVDDWHKESGRIYRLRPAGSTPSYGEGDLARLSSSELLTKLNHRNKWIRKRATLELGWRGDQSIVDPLIDAVEHDSSPEGLWAIHLLGKLDGELAGRWICHPDPDIRRITIRLLGDRHESHPAMVEVARDESDLQVRSQLASTARRIDPASGLRILNELTKRDADLQDPHLPLMYWWVLESHADSWEQTKQLLHDESFWRRPIVNDFLLTRLMQRFASRGRSEDLLRCEELIRLSPSGESENQLLDGLNNAFQGRQIPALPPSLERSLNGFQVSRGESGVVMALRRGQKESAAKAIEMLSNPSVEIATRIELAKTLGEVGQPSAISTLVRLATGGYSAEPPLQRVAISALARFDDAKIGTQIVKAFYGRISAEHGLRDTACRTLATRANWALLLLDEVIQWRLPKSEVPPDVIQQLRVYDDPDIVSAVESAFGKSLAISSDKKVEEINRLSKLVSNRRGDADAGKVHFAKKCAICHQLYGEGKSVGPPLDAYERGNPVFWLNSVVAPSLEIREGYQSFQALTADGRVIVGMVVGEDPNAVTLRTADGQAIIVARTELEDFRAINVSLMPEGLFNDLDDQAIVDLFEYLMLGVRR